METLSRKQNKQVANALAEILSDTNDRVDNLSCNLKDSSMERWQGILSKLPVFSSG
jgi:hypothetical protein